MTSPATMSSNRPYLLRALYEWIGDNGFLETASASITVE